MVEAQILVVGVITASIVILSILWFKSKKLDQPPLPPGPRGLPILGYLPFLSSNNLHHDFTKLATKFGPIYRLWLGSKLCVVISSPALAKEVVRDHDKVMANRDVPIAVRVLYPGGLDIAWAPYGSNWRTMRKVFVKDMLSNNNLEAAHVHLKNEVKKSIRFVYSKIGTPINIGELAYTIGLNVIMTMVWGGTLDEELRGTAEEGFRNLSPQVMDLLGKPNISDLFSLPDFLDLQGISKQMKNVGKQLHGLLDLVIDQRMKMMSNGRVEYKSKDDQNTKDFLQILLELKERNDGGAKINISQIKAMIIDMFLGGIDTTATTLEWVMAEILANPNVKERVTQELNDVIGMDTNVEDIHLNRLNYLEAVLKESSRMHPPLPVLVPRSPTQSCIVGGYTIPKDTRVLINVQSIHRDPQAWQNPSKFDPERFLDENGKCDFDGANFQYLPFGSGRRICAGLPLAKTTLMYVLPSLLQSFDWMIPNGEEVDLEDKFGIVVKKKVPLFACPSPRLHNSKLYE
ncbi:hypothetical protein LIER_31346 [Lithospermum erythrorhizon]|uniref:Cytochrome P450 n=1 Tax=Lithospermum erythrorhizon TaxID=34254 RepID=A0AAV3RUG5_LITER